MSGKHTPGPWQAVVGEDNDPNFGAETWGGIVADDLHVARIWNDIGDDDGADGPNPEAAANARLIAAAPELLAALEAIAGRDGVQRVETTLHDKARAAIAKARGDA